MSRKGIYRSAGAVVAVVLGLSAAATFHAGAQERSAPQSQARGTSSGHATHGTFDECANACADCQRACDSCARHCLALVAEGAKEHEQTLQTCLDCAEICAAADRVVSRRGPFSDTICGACAEACERCAKSCERFPDDEHMAACAKQCRACQQACESMLNHVAGNARSGQPNGKKR